MDWKTGESHVVVDKVDSPSEDAVFQGIYNLALPPRCWSRDSTHIFFSTLGKSRKVTAKNSTIKHFMISDTTM